MRCADAADAAGAPREGTAPPAEQWFLLEHAGPWGRIAYTQSGLDAADVQALTAWARRTRGRVLLVRRPGRVPRSDAPRRWFRIDSRRGREEIRAGHAPGPLTPDAPGTYRYAVTFAVWAPEGDGFARHDTHRLMVWATDAQSARRLAHEEVQTLADYLPAWRVRRVVRVPEADGA